MYKGFNHFQKLKKTLQKTLHKRTNIKLSWVSVAWLHKSAPGEKGSMVLTLSHKNCMQISYYLPQHSDIQNHRYRYGCSIISEIFQNKHSHITYAWSPFLVSGRSAQAQLRHGMALGQRTWQSLHYVCRCKLLPAWQQPAARHLILRKSENGKAEKNTFPALLLLLSNCACHGVMVSKCATVAG